VTSNKTVVSEKLNAKLQLSDDELDWLIISWVGKWYAYLFTPMKNWNWRNCRQGKK
jgi:hypothetical protein